MDRVTTPLLHIVNGPNRFLATEVFAAFGLNQRPLDFIVFPEAVHQLQRPRERVEALRITEDWMTFWLKTPGQTNDPAQAARFSRWKRLLEAPGKRF